MINAQNPLVSTQEASQISVWHNIQHSRFAYEVELIWRKVRMMNKWMLLGILVVIQAAVILVGPKVVQYFSQDARTNASVKAGPALIVLSPQTTTVAKGQLEKTKILATTDGHQVLGFQLVANVTGSIPNNLTVIPATISGLEAVIARVDDVAGGKQIKLVFLAKFDQNYVGANGKQGGFKPFATATPVEIGTIEFYGQGSGSMTISFDHDNTMVIENATNLDLAHPPVNLTYTFGAMATSPSPSVVASPTPTPSPVITPSPSPQVSAQPSASPSPTTNTKPGKGNNKKR